MWPGDRGRLAAPAAGGAATPAAAASAAAGGAAAAAATAEEEESIVPTLCCCICTELFEQPMVVSCCGNSFCQKCLDTALAHSDACPMCRAPLIGGIDQVFPNRALAQLVEQARIIGVTRRQRLATSAAVSAVSANRGTDTSAPHSCSQAQAQAQGQAQIHMHAQVQEREADARSNAHSNSGTQVNSQDPSPSQADLEREPSAHSHAAAGSSHGFSSSGSSSIGSSSSHYTGSLEGYRVGPLTSHLQSTPAAPTASTPPPHLHSPQRPSANAPVVDPRQDHTAISIPDFAPAQLISSVPLSQQSLQQGQVSQQQRGEVSAGAEPSGLDSILPDLVVRLSGFGAAAREDERQSAQQQQQQLGQQQHLLESQAQPPQAQGQEHRHQQRQQHRQQRQQRIQQVQQLQQVRCCPSPYAMAVRCMLACGGSGRSALLAFARVRRWFLVNEPRIRFSLFLTISALLVFYLRVQEEEYARVTRYP
ncbi:hypothetical protein CLOP_g4743 [Closterium sp. NIES-67]|nr:hypothetical protein CLOP_g4743 [Closterium sp. NIES-67]